MPKVTTALDDHEIDLGTGQRVTDRFGHSYVKGVLLAPHQQHRLLERVQPFPQIKACQVWPRR